MRPEIPYESWRETCSALHLYTQIVGKYRLARTPWVNHSWHATLYVNARGLTTSIIPDGKVGWRSPSIFSTMQSLAQRRVVAKQVSPLVRCPLLTSMRASWT